MEPKTGQLRDGTAVTLRGYHKRADLPDRVFEEVRALLNSVIADGATYPIEEELDVEGFEQYYCPGFVAVLYAAPAEQKANQGESDAQKQDLGALSAPDEADEAVVGAFYIKPNYPGRSSHICNGGFLVSPAFRGRGAGEFMGRCYVEWAPQLGYRGSVFNLVYANNPGSYRIWDKLGFTRVGIVPGAGRLANADEDVDAIVFYKDFRQ